MPDSFLPMRVSEASSDRHVGRLMRNADREVARHALQAWVLSMKDEVDTVALGDALTTSLEEEVRLVEHGVSMANGSVLELEMVKQKALMYSTINNRRIRRRFGRP